MAVLLQGGAHIGYWEIMIVSETPGPCSMLIMRVAIISYKQLTWRVWGENYDPKLSLMVKRILDHCHRKEYDQHNFEWGI